mgnify:CR=1 FL=1
MKRVQNWRDYLEDNDPSWKEKINRKKKLKDDEYEERPKIRKRSKKNK